MNGLERQNAGRSTQPHSEPRERGVERLIAITTGDRKRRAIIRELGDHVFVVLRIPGCGTEQSVQLGVRELAQSLEANRVGGHDGHANRAAGWTRAGFEEKPCRK
jgi:hypothetical protein